MLFAKSKRGGLMVTQFRIGLLAVGWVLFQAILVADVIYRVAHAQM